MKKMMIMSFMLIGLVVLALANSQNIYANPMENTYDVDVTVLLGNDEVSEANLLNQSYKSQVNVDLSTFETSGRVFVFYLVNGVTLSSTENLIVTSDLNIIAVFKDAGEQVALFIDTNGELIGYDYVLDSQTPDAPDTNLPTKPGYIAKSGESRWSPQVGALSGDQIYVLEYEKTSAVVLSVVINDGLGSGQYAYNDIVVAQPTTLDDFIGWKDASGHIVSFDETYVFTALTDTEVSAYYDETDVTPYPVLDFRNVTGIRANHESFVGKIYLPDAYELIEYGIIASMSYEEITFASNDVVTIQSHVKSSITNEFLRSFEALGFVSYRGYMVVYNGTEDVVVYSNEIYFEYSNEIIITFDSKGGTEVSSQTLYESGYVGEPTNPTKDQLEFVGWFTDLASETPFDFDQEVSQSITLYAKWIVLPGANIMPFNYQTKAVGIDFETVLLPAAKPGNNDDFTPEKGLSELWNGQSNSWDAIQLVNANDEVVPGWIYIDLGYQYEFNLIFVSFWHDWWFKNVTIQASNQADFSDAFTIFANNDSSSNVNRFGIPRSGFATIQGDTSNVYGWGAFPQNISVAEQPDGSAGLIFNFETIEYRYIRIFANHSDNENLSLYSEIAVYRTGIE